MSEYVHHYSKIQANNVAKVRDWLQAGSAPKTSVPPLQTSNEVDTQAERMKTLSLNEARGGELDSKAEDVFYKIKEDSLNELRCMFPNLNPHQLYQVLTKNQFNLQRAVESLLDIPPSSTKSRNIAKIGSSFSDNRAVTRSGNAVSVTTRTEPLHHLRTETTANSQTRRSSQTVSGTKSSSVSSNVTRSTPHTFETCNTMAIMARNGSLPPPVSLLSPSRCTPALPGVECVVCFSSLAGCRMYQDMYQCAQGHSLCADCHEREWLRGHKDLIESQMSETDSSLPEYGAVTHMGNAGSETYRTEPLHNLRTEITANSRTRSSQTVFGTKSSVVSSNVNRTTPHSFDTCSIHNVHRSHQGSIPTPVSLLSLSGSTPAIPIGSKCAACFSFLERAVSKIYQCAQGHLLCEDCNEKEWVKGFVDSNISKTDTCLNDYGAVTHTGNAVSVTTRTEPLYHLRTEITVNSRTKRSSQTVSGTKSSLVSCNVTCTTPHTLDSRSILTGQRSRQASRSSPVSPVSPVSQSAPPAIPPCPECPVCFSSLAGSRIYQCAQGHSLCGDCNKNPQVKNCPTCRGKLMGRATNMEQLLASIYSGE